jgi:hypothetical protein
MSRRSSVFAAFALLSLALTACEARYPPMPEQWASSEIPAYQSSPTLPPATFEGATPDGSLLEGYAARTPRAEEELEGWLPPFQAKTMVVELLIAAAKDDPYRMRLLLADNARWGIPHRGELRARPITTAEDPLGLEFLDAFRHATSRFGKQATFSCTPLQPGWQVYVTAGAEPIWCFYTAADNLDIISFRLIMVGGRLATDYVGFFRERQAGAMHTPEAGEPPPLTPYTKRAVDLSPPALMHNGSNPVSKPAQGQAPPRRDAADQPIPVHR